MSTTRFAATAVALSFLVVAPRHASAQGTLADYQRAATVTQRMSGLTLGVAQSPIWTGPTRLTYRRTVKGGFEFVVVDAATGEKRVAFDHARLAAALSTASGSAFTATALPFTEFSYVERDDAAIEVDVRDARWRCSLADYRCTAAGQARNAGSAGRRGAAAPPGGCVPTNQPHRRRVCRPPIPSAAAAAAGEARVAQPRH